MFRDVWSGTVNDLPETFALLSSRMMRDMSTVAPFSCSRIGPIYRTLSTLLAAERSKAIAVLEGVANRYPGGRRLLAVERGLEVRDGQLREARVIEGKFLRRLCGSGDRSAGRLDGVLSRLGCPDRFHLQVLLDSGLILGVTASSVVDDEFL